jgi:F-type H+-transporting ATPase subunit b
MHVVAANNFLLPDGANFFAELFAFVIILAVLWRWVVPPVQRSLNQRQQAIRDQFERAEQARESGERAEREYQQAAAQTREESARIREEAHTEARQIVEEAKTRAREEAEAVTRREQARLETQRQQVVAELRHEIGALAVSLANRIVGESLDDDDRQRRVVDRFLADLEAQGSGDGQTASASGEPAGTGQQAR